MVECTALEMRHRCKPIGVRIPPSPPRVRRARETPAKQGYVAGLGETVCSTLVEHPAYIALASVTQPNPCLTFRSSNPWPLGTPRKARRFQCAAGLRVRRIRLEQPFLRSNPLRQNDLRLGGGAARTQATPGSFLFVRSNVERTQVLSKVRFT